MNTKPCSKCALDKPFSDFSPDKRARGGLQAQCKNCRNASMKQSRLDDPKRAAEIARASYERNAEAVKERARAYYHAHADECRERGLAWRRANGPRLREYFRAYRIKNVAAVRLKERNYEHRRRANTIQSDVTPAAWAERVAEFGGRCAYCATFGPTEMEHIMPVSRGGTHTMDNLVPACRSCNASKRNDTLLVFLLRRAG